MLYSMLLKSTGSRFVKGIIRLVEWIKRLSEFFGE